MSRRLAASATLLLAALFAPAPAVAQTGWQFTRIADTATAAPGLGANFGSFDFQVAVRNNFVAFKGTAGTNQGVYVAQVGSAPTAVANALTAVPAGGGGGTFNGVEPPSVDAAGNVAFVGTTTGGRSGVYARVGGTLGVVADSATATPNFSGTFSQFDNRGGASIDQGQVAFSARSFGPGSTVQEGVYLRNGGTLTRLMDRTNTIPGSSTNFIFISRPALRDGTAVFTGGTGSGGQNGVYTVPAAGGALTRVADQTTPLPGGQTFALEGSVARGPTIDNGQVGVFSVNGFTAQTGFYGGTVTGSPLTVIANGTTVPTGASQPFNNFDMLSISDGDSALFAATPGGNFDVWSDLDSTGFRRVIGVGMTLDGKTVSQLRMGRYAFDNRTIGFWAQFTDGSSGVYAAVLPVPEPAGVLAAALTAVGVFWRRRAV